MMMMMMLSVVTERQLLRPSNVVVGGRGQRALVEATCVEFVHLTRHHHSVRRRRVASASP